MVFRWGHSQSRASPFYVKIKTRGLHFFNARQIISKVLKKININLTICLRFNLYTHVNIDLLTVVPFRTFHSVFQVYGHLADCVLWGGLLGTDWTVCSSPGLFYWSCDPSLGPHCPDCCTSLQEAPSKSRSFQVGEERHSVFTISTLKKYSPIHNIITGSSSFFNLNCFPVFL